MDVKHMQSHRTRLALMEESNSDRGCATLLGPSHTVGVREVDALVEVREEHLRITRLGSDGARVLLWQELVSQPSVSSKGARKGVDVAHLDGGGGRTPDAFPFRATFALKHLVMMVVLRSKHGARENL